MYKPKTFKWHFTGPNLFLSVWFVHENNYPANCANVDVFPVDSSLCPGGESTDDRKYVSTFAGKRIKLTRKKANPGEWRWPLCLQ